MSRIQRRRRAESRERAYGDPTPAPQRVRATPVAPSPVRTPGRATITVARANRRLAAALPDLVHKLILLVTRIEGDEKICVSTPATSGSNAAQSGKNSQPAVSAAGAVSKTGSTITLAGASLSCGQFSHLCREPDLCAP